jgi:hypothetical protein
MDTRCLGAWMHTWMDGWMDGWVDLSVNPGRL